MANLDDFDDDLEDLIGQHRYSQTDLEQFAMAPLVMRDFTCIYESLMIIKWHYENNDNPPNITLPDWKLYVLMHFNSEDYRTQ